MTFRRERAIRAPKAARGIFAEFKDDPDPEVRQRASNWSLAIGLQDVDHLSVSQFLIDTAKRNIRGEITHEKVARLIEERCSMGCGIKNKTFGAGAKARSMVNMRMKGNVE